MYKGTSYMSGNRSLKIALTGTEKSGKTCLFNAWAYNEFNQTRMTIGAYFGMVQAIGTQETINLAIWDTAGNMKFESLTNFYFRGVDLLILCFAADQDFKAQEEYAKTRLAAYRAENSQKTRSYHFYCVLTKSDLDEKSHKTTVAQVEKFATDNKATRKTIVHSSKTETAKTTGRFNKLIIEDGSKLGITAADQKTAANPSTYTKTKMSAALVASWGFFTTNNVNDAIAACKDLSESADKVTLIKALHRKSMETTWGAKTQVTDNTFTDINSIRKYVDAHPKSRLANIYNALERQAGGSGSGPATPAPTNS
ncbi:hypothetical protein AYO45_02505 [Gammaproteobacteria bacterium SCGC AG-212-F23]|nr:hypothetical protein AYO45_02505 [Gammaproteobacteria bacterium SCGC AG-212-F23]